MRRRNFVCFTLLLAVLVLVMAGASWAQVNTVNLSGTVMDPQGLAVKGAKVTIKNPGTGLEREVVSDANGHYEIVGVPPGSYTLTVEAAGFATLTNTSFKLTLGTTPGIQPTAATAEPGRDSKCDGGARSGGYGEDGRFHHDQPNADRQPAYQWAQLHKFHAAKFSGGPGRHAVDRSCADKRLEFRRPARALE